MNVQVRLFAVARDLAGVDHIELSLPESATVGQLRTALAAQCPSLSDTLQRSMIAVNEEYAQDAQVLPADADVACIPPVSGGGG